MIRQDLTGYNLTTDASKPDSDGLSYWFATRWTLVLFELIFFVLSRYLKYPRPEEIVTSGAEVADTHRAVTLLAQFSIF